MFVNNADEICILNNRTQSVIRIHARFADLSKSVML